MGAPALFQTSALSVHPFPVGRQRLLRERLRRQQNFRQLILAPAGSVQRRINRQAYALAQVHFYRYQRELWQLIRDGEVSLDDLEACCLSIDDIEACSPRLPETNQGP